MKIKEIVAVIGSYTDKTGQIKKNFRTVGELHQKEDGSFFILMDKSFNLAAVQQKNPTDVKVVLACYDPKAKEETPATVTPQYTAQQYRDAKNGDMAQDPVRASFVAQAPTDEFDDEVPF